MAIGIPSISTNVYAIPEAVHNEQTGILIEAGDIDALSSAVLRLQRDGALRKHLSGQGSEYVLKHFDERDAAALCIASYERALDGNNNRNL
jgi:glycosyltransferase involved in cell wall biosynthesis